MPLIDYIQLAEILAVKPSTIKANARDGRWDRVPPPIKIGRQNRWDMNVVEHWLKERQVRF